MKLPGLSWLVLFVAVSSAPADDAGKERSFTQPVAVVQAALKKIGPTSGRLPLLEGFVVGPTNELESYQRPYYQLVVHIASGTAGGSLVRVAAKITAWNPAGQAGYRVLPSNGRLESDLLDRLEEALRPAAEPASVPSGQATAQAAHPATPAISAPVPQMPRRATPSVSAPTVDNPALEREARSLAEILRNQSHPENLVAVKQDLTPVLQSPSADAKVLFLASAEDEFEILDLNSEWVHVRISGLARGWLRRSLVEFLDTSKSAENERLSQPPSQTGQTSPSGEGIFSISSEQVGSFPGDWAPLKGRSVRIISVRQTPANGRITSPEEKMRFAASELKKQGPSPESVAGVVLIFDAEDGGMVAAPRTALEQWKAGVLSDQRFWQECYLDPPEILGPH